MFGLVNIFRRPSIIALVFFYAALRWSLKDWQITTDFLLNLNRSETRASPILGSLQLLFNWHKHPSEILWVAALYLFYHIDRRPYCLFTVWLRVINV